MNLQKSNGHQRFYIRNGQLFEVTVNEKNQMSHNLILIVPGLSDMDLVDDATLKIVSEKYGGLQVVQWRGADVFPKFIEEREGVLISDRTWGVTQKLNLIICAYNKFDGHGFWWDITNEILIEPVIFWCPLEELMPKGIAEIRKQQLATNN